MLVEHNRIVGETTQLYCYFRQCSNIVAFVGYLQYHANMLSTAKFCAKVDAFLERTGMKPSRLGRDAIGDSKFVFNLRDGRSPSLDTVEKLENFMRSKARAR